MRKLIATFMIVAMTTSAAGARDWAIALPESFPGGKAPLEAPVWGFFTGTLGAGDRYRVINGTALGRIAVIDVPRELAYTRAKHRARRFQPQNAQIFGHLNATTSGEARLDLTGLLRREALNRTDPDLPLALLVIGDAAQGFPASPSFSMRDGEGGFRVPADGHLNASFAASPWGIGVEGKTGLKGVTLHHCQTGGSALAPIEEEALRRFWTLYIAARGGVLATWENDLATCFERFARRIERPMIEARPNPKDRLLVMRKLGRDKVAVAAASEGKTVINGVEVDDFNLFADKPHPTLSGVKVLTGIRYKPAEYPKRYEEAWCYFSVFRNGTDIRFSLGDKSPGRAPRLRTGTASARSAAGISLSDVRAGQRACQWPNS